MDKHSPLGSSGAARGPQLPAFLSPDPFPPATPRPVRRRPDRLATVTIGEAALVAVISGALGIAIAPAVYAPVPLGPAAVEVIR